MPPPKPLHVLVCTWTQELFKRGGRKLSRNNQTGHYYSRVPFLHLFLLGVFPLGISFQDLAGVPHPSDGSPRRPSIHPKQIKTKTRP